MDRRQIEKEIGSKPFRVYLYTIGALLCGTFAYVFITLSAIPGLVVLGRCFAAASVLYGIMVVLTLIPGMP